MTDRYERIRAALAMGPTHGPWEWEEGQSIITRKWDGKEWPIASVECSRLGWHENKRCAGLEAGANAALIAACNPGTILALLEERDELAKLVMEMRGTLRDLRIHLHAAGRRPEECYEMSMIDDALHLAAIDKARGKGEP